MFEWRKYNFTIDCCKFMRQESIAWSRKLRDQFCPENEIVCGEIFSMRSSSSNADKYRLSLAERLDAAEYVDGLR